MIGKDFRFEVEIDWEGGRLTRARSAGKPDLAVATPPEFKSGIEGVWSPEDLVVAAAASCFAVTFVATAERLEIPVRGLKVDGTGHVGRRSRGRFGFIAVELVATIETEPGFEHAAEQAARLAEEGCLVARALGVPVHLETTVRAPAPAVAR